nr:hypothetical protein [Tanacetum cinerariifolium]
NALANHCLEYKFLTGVPIAIYKFGYINMYGFLLNMTMDTTIDQQLARDEALVPHAKRLRIKRSNFYLLSNIKSKESTLQLVYDVLRLTPFFKVFLVTADVLKIYMQEFWATSTVHHHSIRSKMGNKKHIINLESFRNSNAYKEYYAVATGATPPNPKANDDAQDDEDQEDEGNDEDDAEEEPRDKESFDPIPKTPEDTDDEGNGEENPGINEYYAVATGATPPNPKASVQKTRSSSDTTITPPTAVVSPRLTTFEKGKQAAKASKAKSLSALSEASGSGADEGTGSIPGVPNVPTDESEEEISWNSTDEEGKKDTMKRKMNYTETSILIKEGQSSSVSSQFVTSMLNLTPDAVMEFIFETTSNLYKALVDTYEFDKIILDTYEDTVALKRRRDDDADKDEEPSAGSDRGSKRRREGKERESTSPPKEKVTRSAGKSTKGSKSQQMSASESATAYEPMQTTFEMEEPTHPQFETGADDQLIVESSQHPKWFSQQQKPPSLDMDTLTPELLSGPTYELMKGSCKSMVELEYQLEEVYKATTDQLDWVNPEGHDEEEDELYRDVNINQGRCIQTTKEVEDLHVTLTPVNPDGQQ